MRTINLYTTVFLFLIFSLKLHAQVQDLPIENLLKSYINKINSLNKNSSNIEILDLYSDQYSGSTTYVKISGAIIKKEYTKKDIADQLNDIINDNNYTFKLALKNIIYSSQKEKAATLSALLNFESFIDMKIAEKGTMHLNIVGTHSDDGWKINQNNMIRVSETKEIGKCVCNLYTKGSNKFVTELFYPSGVEYTHILESFAISNKNGKRFIRYNGKSYEWDKQNLNLTYDSNVLGQPKEPKDAIKLILSNQYQEPCADIIFY